MLLYSLSCIDNKTGNEMIASELSFNGACSYLGETLRLPINGVKGKTGGDYIFFENSEPRFVYDESRGFLMRIREKT